MLTLIRIAAALVALPALLRLATDTDTPTDAALDQANADAEAKFTEIEGAVTAAFKPLPRDSQAAETFAELSKGVRKLLSMAPVVRREVNRLQSDRMANPDGVSAAVAEVRHVAEEGVTATHRDLAAAAAKLPDQLADLAIPRQRGDNLKASLNAQRAEQRVERRLAGADNARERAQLLARLAGGADRELAAAAYAVAEDTLDDDAIAAVRHAAVEGSAEHGSESERAAAAALQELPTVNQWWQGASIQARGELRDGAR